MGVSERPPPGVAAPGDTPPPPPPLSTPPATPPPPKSPPPPTPDASPEARPPPELLVSSARDAAIQFPRRRCVVIPPSPSRFDLQNRLLSELHDCIVPDLLAPSAAPAPVWVTPPSLNPRFNSFFIKNALCHCLAPRPSRLSVVRVHVAVFVVTVSSKSFADALVISGVLQLADVRLAFHPSLESAVLAVSRLPPFTLKPSASAGVQIPNASFTETRTSSPTGVLPADSLPVTPLEAIQLGSVPVDLLRVAPIPFPSLPGTGGRRNVLSRPRRQLCATSSSSASMRSGPAPTWKPRSLLPRLKLLSSQLAEP